MIRFVRQLCLLYCAVGVAACEPALPQLAFDPPVPTEGLPFSITRTDHLSGERVLQVGAVTAVVAPGERVRFAAPAAGSRSVSVWHGDRKIGEIPFQVAPAPGRWYIAYGNRVDLNATTSVIAWKQELDRIVTAALDGIPDPATAPILLLLAESLGLPALLSGPDLDEARAAETALEAFATFASVRPQALDRIDALFPDQRLSLPRRLMLATADSAQRTFSGALAALAARHGIWIAASNDMPRVRPSRDPDDLAAFAALDPDTDVVWIPTGPEVFNTGVLYGPDGRLHLQTDKVNLTPTEIDLLDLSAGAAASVTAIDTAFGRVCLAISLDAFTDEYVDLLTQARCRVMLQPDANSQVWAGYTCPGTSDCGDPGPDNGYWQPDEWLYSVLGAVSRSPTVELNLTSMMTGLLYDTVFDGQSSISIAADQPSEPAFIGQYRTSDGSGPLERCGVGTMSVVPCRARFVSVAPWAFTGVTTPIDPDPADLQQRRERLRLLGESLLRGGSRENQFVENRAIWWEVQ